MIAEDWHDNISETEKLTLIKYHKLAKISCVIGNILAFMTVFTYHVPTLFQFDFSLRTPSNLTDVPGRNFTFISVYPFDVTPFYIYKLVVFGQFTSAYISCVGFAFSDLLFASIVFHACSTMKNFSYKIHHMFNNKSFDIQKILPILIARHCRIIE